MGGGLRDITSNRAAREMGQWNHLKKLKSDPQQVQKASGSAALFSTSDRTDKSLSAVVITHELHFSFQKPNT